ncbi:MAG: sigma 54-interacting transcriptional regulator [Desulfobacterales bacterium]|nr:sigma 54-interacting transcriptional regulator [Desulfobacterales bacterium]
MDISKYWKTVFETLQDGLLIVDPEGVILSINPAAEKLTGYTAEELVGKSCRILDCTGCKIFGEGPAERWCSLYAEGGIKVKNCMIRNKAKHALNIVKSASVLYDEKGKIIGAVEILHDLSEVVRQQQEIALLRKSCHLDDGYHGLLGESPAMTQMFELIDSVSPSEAPVLVLGQSGTGKELVARAIHESSARHEKPFIKVNCAALNENLLESELFGHVKGAYTGASQARVGRFEAAHEGTIFLDEIGDIPLSTQVKLLRVLEEKEIERVGDQIPIPVDVRIITATNKNLDDLTAQGQFREDLFFRINVFPISCPPLKDRLEDIPLIVQHFIDESVLKSGKQIRGLAPDAMHKLLEYSWPGNVRELRNAIEYAMVLCPEAWIHTKYLPPKITNAETLQHKVTGTVTLFQTEREKLINALRRTGGNQSMAGQMLGVSRVTIWKWIKKYKIDLAEDL